MITTASSLVDVAFEVCTVLDRAGVTVVMTGGSAATFHAPEANESDDIDFIIAFSGGGGVADLAGLGFVLDGKHYVHPQTHFLLEFPTGPLAIGDDLVTTWQTARRGNQVLHVLSALDSCRDRLAQYLFWNDFNGLEQAIAVYTYNRDAIDLDVIRAWCARERQLDKFELFRERTEA